MSLEIYLKWWSTWRTFPVPAWLKAAKLYRSGEFSKAESFYLQGLQRNPNHPARFSARLDLAYCLFKSRKISQAEEQLKHVISQAPQLRESYVRLARIQLWSGRSSDAVWTLRRAAQRIEMDADLAALFLIAAIENGGPGYILKEAVAIAKQVTQEGEGSDLLRVAHARLLIHRGERSRGRSILRDLAFQENSLFEAVVAFSEVLIEDNEIDEAVRHLRRALLASPDHPRVLSLLAAAYLRESDIYNPEYSKQLATTACQVTEWQGPREMHLLAEAYHRVGDKMSALILASKARDAGTKLLGAYPDVRNLDKLIETLSSGTQA